MTQTTIATPLTSAILKMLQTSWNCTTVPGSISKIIIALHHHRLYADTIEESAQLRERGSFSHISRFLSQVEQIQALLDIDENSGIILAHVIETIQDTYPYLAHNYQKLNESNLVQHLNSFDTDFRGRIQTIYSLKDIHIIETDKPRSAFYAIVNGQSQSRVWETLDQATLGAIAIKYDGINSQAEQFFCKMVGI